MPAPLHSNVGSLISQLNAGGGSLVPASQGLEIEENEYGAMECQRSYYCRNTHYPAIRPAFGAAPINPPDMDLAFMGAYTSRFRRNACTKGVGILDVVYRGAHFSSSDPDATTVPLHIQGTQKDAVAIGHYKNVHPGSGESWQLQSWITVIYFAIELSYQYVSRTNPPAPRFLTMPQEKQFTVADAATDYLASAAHGLVNGDYVRLRSTGTLPAPLSTTSTYIVVGATTHTFQLHTVPLGGDQVNITNAGTGDHFVAKAYGGPTPVVLSKTAVNARSLNFGGTSTDDSGGLPGLLGVGVHVPLPALAIPGPFAEYGIETTEFRREPWGQYWSVRETGLVKIYPIVPSPIAGYLTLVP